MSKGIPVICVVLAILFQVIHVSAWLGSVKRDDDYGDLPKAPSSAVDKGMEAVLAACDFANRYKLAYVANGYFAVKDFRDSGSSKLCDNCSKKPATKSSSWTDKLTNLVTSGFTTREGVALLTFVGGSVCEMAESYRKE